MRVNLFLPLIPNYKSLAPILLLLLWASQVSHAAVTSRLGTNNALRAVLRTWSHQRPLRPLKLTPPVQIVTAGTQIRPRRCRGPGRDGLASSFQTSRSACLVQLGDVLKSRTRARWSGLVGIAPYLRDDMMNDRWLSMLWSNYCTYVHIGAGYPDGLFRG
ncbi:hypothetical protein EDB86DRAFT_1044518 [Lactarius hatsudake]|nr:hypothetical protein EDB86DRAFT_1044518 [Lactarius hatsudake]